MSARILITGGAGFIGSAVARMLIGETEDEVLVLDNTARTAKDAANSLN